MHSYNRTIKVKYASSSLDSTKCNTFHEIFVIVFFQDSIMQSVMHLSVKILAVYKSQCIERKSYRQQRITNPDFSGFLALIDIEKVKEKQVWSWGKESLTV